MHTPKTKGGPAGTTRTALRQNESIQILAHGQARKPEGRTYLLEKSAPKASGQPRPKPKPPRPKPGERGALAYSPRDLKALYATAHACDWQCLVTLTGPREASIDNWPRLCELIRKLKQALTNWHRRRGLPRALFVVEFDPPSPGKVAKAHFHLGFELPLDDDQQAALCGLWLKLTGRENNQGRIFHCEAGGGGSRLADYLAKDVRGRRYLKYPAPWLPVRLEVRLWFVVGLARRPARQGAKMLAVKGIRRRQFDLLPWHRSEARRQSEARPCLPSDSEHASTHSTAYSTQKIWQTGETEHDRSGLFWPNNNPMDNEIIYLREYRLPYIEAYKPPPMHKWTAAGRAKN